MNKKIIFSAGGTGGHIFPAINLMKYFSGKGYKVLLVTDARGDNLLNKYYKFKSHIITTDTPMKKNFFKKISSYTVIFFSIIRSFFILIKERPNLVFGFGGYVSFPLSFASRFFNIPLIIYENNLVLGRANKALLPFAKKLLLGTTMPNNLNKKYENKVSRVGNILREEIINYSVKKKDNDKNFFSILVLGGSQGADIFGKIIPSTIKMLKDEGKKIKINQQCVASQKKSLIEFYNKNYISNYVFDFSSNILELISSSDLAISRCGASTTAELLHTFTPFIAVPYPHSMDNHQYLNAQYYESKGYCWLLEQDNFSSLNLFNLIISIINDKKKLENIYKNMKKNDSTNVYDKVETEVKKYI